MSAGDERRHVVIVGGGFAGLGAAKRLAGEDGVRVTLIDRNNYHQFQPLLYQVATSQLAGTDIAYPLRKLFHRDENVDVKMAEIATIDPVTRTVTATDGETWSADAIVLGAGSQPNFFQTTGARGQHLPALLADRRAAPALARDRRVRGRRSRPLADRAGRAALRDRRRRPDRRRAGRGSRGHDPRDDDGRVPRPRGLGGRGAHRRPRAHAARPVLRARPRLRRQGPAPQGRARPSRRRRHRGHAGPRGPRRRDDARDTLRDLGRRDQGAVAGRLGRPPPGPRRAHRRRTRPDASRAFRAST